MIDPGLSTRIESNKRKQVIEEVVKGLSNEATGRKMSIIALTSHEDGDGGQ